VGPAPVAERT